MQRVITFPLPASLHPVSFYQVKSRSTPELKHGQVFPEYQLVFPGSAGQITCKGEIGLEWTKDGITLPSQKMIENDHEVEAIYQILDMDDQVEGVYKCINGGRLPFTAEAEVYAASKRFKNNEQLTYTHIHTYTHNHTNIKYMRINHLIHLSE